jgi:hypothetical protein
MNILIATTPEREHWLADCLKSFGTMPVTVRSDYGYELGKIKWAYENTNWDRFWFFQDSVVIKNKQFLQDGWDMQTSVSINRSPAPYGMYLGIYTRETLNKMYIPMVKTKQDSIKYENDWHREYCSHENVPIMFPEFNDNRANGTEERHGRINLVLENDYLIKYKGTWN